MNAPDTLLVGTDFSSAATKAVVDAADLAVLLGLRLRILHVFDTFELDPADWPADGEIESKFEALIETLPGELKVESRVLESNIARSILEESAAPEVAAVVVGYSGKSGFFQRIGSTASKVSRRSWKPVFVLTSSFTAKSPVVGCLDFSKTSQLVIEWTRRMIEDTSHPGHFAHVAIPLKRLIEYNLGDGDEFSPIPTFGGSEALYRKRIEAAIRRIEGIREEDELEIHFKDSIGKGLEDISASSYPALLVIGRTEHNALHDRLLGSTAEGILDYSNCSTLVVAGRGEHF